MKNERKCKWIGIFSERNYLLLYEKDVIKNANKFDKTHAENRAKSTKRSARVKFAKYEALCASDWYVGHYVFWFFRASEKAVRFIHNHRRNILENHDFCSTKVPFSRHESVTLRSWRWHFVLMKVALRDPRNVTSWLNNRNLASHLPRCP